MLKFIGRILKFAGPDAGKLKLSFVISFFENMFTNVPIFAAFIIFGKILDGTLTANDAWTAGGIMLASLVVRYALRRWFYELESGTGYDICARERIAIGDYFKHFPMSYFTEGNLGNVTSVIAVDIQFVEQHGMMALDKVINSFAAMVIGCLTLLFVDWRISLISVFTCLLALYGLIALEKVTKKQSKIRQEQQSKLTSAVLEYIQGIGVIKSLHVSGDKAKTVKTAVEETCEHAIDFEEEFKRPYIRFSCSFALGTALTVFVGGLLCLGLELSVAMLIVAVIFVFQIYRPIMALSTLTAQIRVMEAALDRYKALQNVEIIDKDGKDIKLDRFDIEFKNVDFSYEQKETLKNISFKVPEKSMTALCGASGSGKTTIANLIVRFWDVQQGEVLIGGRNVKEMTCDSLLENMAMVFQKVYLFQDTIAANIRFGRPDATDEEVIEAAKKARCHEFIMALPENYHTIIGEGGSTLSGGEKQRISIARAILKDAPIILLDEATASVDPDNEKYIQQAINELVKDKTLILIAHRLSTIKNADQILVIDDGKLVQQGTHDELVTQGGQYSNLWKRRVNARSWKIATKA